MAGQLLSHRRPLQRNIAVLLRRILVALVLENLQGIDQARTGVARLNDIVDESAAGGDIRIGEGLAILIRQFFLARDRILCFF